MLKRDDPQQVDKSKSGNRSLNEKEIVIKRLIISYIQIGHIFDDDICVILDFLSNKIKTNILKVCFVLIH